MTAPLTRIFLVGVPRSGTTLLQSLLASHTRLTSFTESHFFDRNFRALPFGRSVLIADPRPHLRAFLSENGEAPSAAAHQLTESQGLGSKLRRPFASRAVARQLVEILDQIAVQRGALGWVEKTPRHLHHIAFLERTLERTSPLHFVHLVRNGTDVVASLHRASRQWPQHYEVPDCIHRWNTDLERSQARIGSSRDHFVTYEDLVASPQRVLEQLLEALGFEWQDTILERYGKTSIQLIAEHERNWKANLRQPIHPSSKTSDSFSREQRRTIEDALNLQLYDTIKAHALG